MATSEVLRVNDNDQECEHVDILEKAARALREAPVPDGPSSAALNEVLTVVREAVDTSPRTGRLGSSWYRLGNYVIHPSRTAGWRAAVLASAACTLIALTVLIVFSAQRGAFAAGLDHMRKARSIVCHVRKTTRIQMQPDLTGEVSTIDSSAAKAISNAVLALTEEEKLYVSTEHGVRINKFEDGALVRTIYLRPGQPTLILDPVERAYYVAHAHEGGMPEAYSETSSLDPISRMDMTLIYHPYEPHRLIDGLRNMRGDADRMLGRKTIDGRDAIGYEIAGERVGFGPPWTDYAEENRAELWLDAATDVPLRLAFSYVQRIAPTPQTPTAVVQHVSAVYDGFEWDTPRPAEWFNVAIPSDFTSRDEMPPEQTDMPGEAAFLKSLEFFRESTGRYPSTLDLNGMKNEIVTLAVAMYGERVAANGGRDVGPEAPIVVPLAKLKGLTRYAYLMIADQDPEYFGDAVTPMDADEVLMRWNLDSEHRRVIYGDLRIETVPRRD
jgi:hypothetical protein